MKTYGGICWFPEEKEWQTWNSGDTLNALVNSARRPEKAKLFRKTSRYTSLFTFSTVPGFDRPRRARLVWKWSYVSRNVLKTGLFVNAPSAPLLDCCFSEPKDWPAGMAGIKIGGCEVMVDAMAVRMWSRY